MNPIQSTQPQFGYIPTDFPSQRGQYPRITQDKLKNPDKLEPDKKLTGEVGTGMNSTWLTPKQPKFGEGCFDDSFPSQKVFDAMAAQVRNEMNGLSPKEQMDWAVDMGIKGIGAKPSPKLSFLEKLTRKLLDS